MVKELRYELDILPRKDMANHWEATTVERLLETLKETIVDSVMMGMEVRIRRIKKKTIKKLTRCPQCNEKLIPALKGETSAWCDNCCCEITMEEKNGKKNIQPKSNT